MGEARRPHVLAQEEPACGTSPSRRQPEPAQPGRSPGSTPPLPAVVQGPRHTPCQLAQVGEGGPCPSLSWGHTHGSTQVRPTCPHGRRRPDLQPRRPEGWASRAGVGDRRGRWTGPWWPPRACPPGSLVPLTRVQFTLQVGLLQRRERAVGSGSPGPATLRANRLSREHSRVFQSFE